MSDVDDILTALADPTRRRVVELLRKGPRRAGELAVASDTSAPAMSRHLRVLRESGVIEDERGESDARVRMFQLRRDAFRRLQTWVVRMESYWTEQPDAFKNQAERGRRRK